MKFNTYCRLTVMFLLILFIPRLATQADETCMSPYMAKIVGQEDFVYVWTLGTQGVGDEQDKLVVIDVNPKSPGYGKVVHSVSVDASHALFTDYEMHNTGIGVAKHHSSAEPGIIMLKEY